jgi:hypothetical protein
LAFGRRIPVSRICALPALYGDRVVRLCCQAGLDTWLCFARKTATTLHQYSVFGAVALAIALLNLLRPSIVLFSVALAVTGLGVVLYNTTLSAFAAGLLILSLARPASAAE